jgi:uncharacterized membrane protein HdeD (DUF308 family)
MVAENIKSAYSRTKWALVFRGLLGIALGVLIIMKPLASVEVFALVIAIWALADGLVNIVHAFDLRSVAPHWWALLLAGLVSAGFGVAAFYYYPALSLAFAVTWTALWLITAGVLGIYVAVQERTRQLPWGWTLTFSLIALAAGVLAIAYPGVTVGTLMTLLATFGILGGIALLVGAGKMQSFEHDVRQAFPEKNQYTESSKGTRGAA